MLTETETAATDLSEWDGTRPYRYAAFSVYPISLAARHELETAFAQEVVPAASLPDKIWPDLDAALSRHRGFVEDMRWDQPCAKTRSDLGRLKKRLRRDAEELEGFLLNETSRTAIGPDAELWYRLVKELEKGPPMIEACRANLEGCESDKGPDIEHQRITTAILQNILIRHGLSLIAHDGKKKRGRVAFLAHFFALATDPVSQTRASRLIETIVDKGQVVPSTSS